MFKGRRPAPAGPRQRSAPSATALALGVAVSARRIGPVLLRRGGAALAVPPTRGPSHGSLPASARKRRATAAVAPMRARKGRGRRRLGIEVGGPVSRAARPGHGGTALADAGRGDPPTGPSPRPDGKRRAAASGPRRPSHGPPQTPGPLPYMQFRTCPGARCPSSATPEPTATGPCRGPDGARPRLAARVSLTNRLGTSIVSLTIEMSHLADRSRH